MDEPLGDEPFTHRKDLFVLKGEPMVFSLPAAETDRDHRVKKRLKACILHGGGLLSDTGKNVKRLGLLDAQPPEGGMWGLFVHESVNANHLQDIPTYAYRLVEPPKKGCKLAHRPSSPLRGKFDALPRNPPVRVPDGSRGRQLFSAEEDEKILAFYAKHRGEYGRTSQILWQKAEAHFPNRTFESLRSRFKVVDDKQKKSAAARALIASRAGKSSTVPNREASTKAASVATAGSNSLNSMHGVRTTRSSKSTVTEDPTATEQANRQEVSSSSPAKRAASAQAQRRTKSAGKEAQAEKQRRKRPASPPPSRPRRRPRTPAIVSSSESDSDVVPSTPSATRPTTPALEALAAKLSPKQALALGTNSSGIPQQETSSRAQDDENGHCFDYPPPSGSPAVENARRQLQFQEMPGTAAALLQSKFSSTRSSPRPRKARSEPAESSNGSDTSVPGVASRRFNGLMPEADCVDDVDERLFSVADASKGRTKAVPPGSSSGSSPLTSPRRVAKPTTPNGKRAPAPDSLLPMSPMGVEEAAVKSTPTRHLSKVFDAHFQVLAVMSSNRRSYTDAASLLRATSGNCAHATALVTGTPEADIGCHLWTAEEDEILLNGRQSQKRHLVETFSEDLCDERMLFLSS